MEMSKSKQTFRVTGRKTIETPITILVGRKYQIHRRTAFAIVTDNCTEPNTGFVCWQFYFK